jgi:hypothetical protein
VSDIEKFLKTKAPMIKNNAFFEERELFVYHQVNDYTITLNREKNPNYVSLFHHTKVVGKLTTSEIFKKGVAYLKIGSIDIDGSHRGNRLSLPMYKALLENTSSAGIVSNHSDRANKSQIPSVYKRLGAKNIDDTYYMVESEYSKLNKKVKNRAGLKK